MRTFALFALLAGAILPGVVCAQTRVSPASSGCAPSGRVQFVCGEVNPEDLVALPGDKWVVASWFGGAGGIHLVRVVDRTTTALYPSPAARDDFDRKTYGAYCPGPMDAEGAGANLHVSGLELDPLGWKRYRLYAVQDGQRESIEVFDIDARGPIPRATWIGCVVAANPTVNLNGVVGLPDGGIMATNFQRRGAAGRAAFAKMMGGADSGEVWEWHPRTGWAQVPDSRGSGPNGLEVSSDGTWVYITMWGSETLVRLSRGSTPVRREVVPLGFRADNVRWGSHGLLFVAGQTPGPGGLFAPGGGTKAVSVDPRTLRVAALIEFTNTPAFGLGTVAIPVGEEIWVGSFHGNRIAILPASR